MTPQRQEWNDRAIDGLAKRVDDLGIELDIVRRLPQAVAKVDERTEALETDAMRLQRAVEIADAREERGFRDLRTYVDKQLDERPEAKASMRSFMVTLAATILVPIIVAVIGALAIVNSGGIP